jgi:hypothetical protein
VDGSTPGTFEVSAYRALWSTFTTVTTPFTSFLSADGARSIA